MNTSDFYAIILVPLVIGVILLIAEYWIIQPLAKRKDNTQSPPKRDQDFSVVRETGLPKIPSLSVPSQPVVHRASTSLRKLLVVLSLLRPKPLFWGLVVFCFGIAFTIFSARMTDTNLATIGIEPSPIPSATPNPIPKLRRLSSDTFADVMLVVDTSGSMQGTKLESLKLALNSFDDNLLPEDRIGLITFAKTASIRLALIDVGTCNPLYTIMINGLSGGGDTALFDAIGLALDHLESHKDTKRKQVIIVITDGLDNNSYQYSSLSEIQNKIQNSIAANPRISIVPITLSSEVDTAFLTNIAQATATQLYFLDTNDSIWWVIDVINRYL